jgi:hypothetical protein
MARLHVDRKTFFNKIGGVGGASTRLSPSQDPLMNLSPARFAIVFLALLVQHLSCGQAPAPAESISHPPLRRDLPLRSGPIAANAIYVDATRGSDQNPGSSDAPLLTAQAAVNRVGPGQTIYLRAGVYRENLYVAAIGTADAPVVISGYPGERAILDGGIAEFFNEPATAWEPVPDQPGEFRSTRPHRNLHLPVGSFGDSLVGLQTYYHAMDLRATQQLVHYADFNQRKTTDHEALYCGPGLWYDPITGRLHTRLAHTDVPAPATNYRGETDPRKLPLIIAAFRSVPMRLDGAQHVTVRDLVIRGGGYDTVKLALCQDITFDHVTIWSGTYGLDAFATRRFTMTDSAMYGSIAPWAFRSDGAKRDYPNAPTRNITRLNAHALIVIDAGREYSVYATPVNDDWTIEHCHFADAHDAAYLGGINVRFAHNLVEDMQDDGLYLSQMYPRHLYMRQGATLDIHHNVFRRVNMPFAFGGFEDTRDTIHVHRNIVDNRWPLLMVRPATQPPAPEVWCGMLMSDHGSPPWPTLRVYHNTFICATNQREAHMRALTAVTNVASRQLFNNLFLHEGGLPPFPAKFDPASGVVEDANLFWGPKVAPQQAADYFNAFRRSEAFEKSKSVYPAGFTTNSRVADPKLTQLSEDAGKCDYRPAADSAALDAGVALPGDWPNADAGTDAAAPDIGALPKDAPMFSVGPR